LQPLQPNDEEEGGGDDEVSDFVEESMAMLNGGDDYELPEPEAEPAHNEGEEEEVEDDDPPAPAARKKPGRPAKGKETAAAKPAKPQKKPAKPVVEEQEDDDHQEEDEHGDEEEEEPAARPQKPAPGRRGRPPKTGTAAPAASQPPARASKKRRSLDEEEAAATQEPSPEPQPKRQRTSPATASKKPAPKKPAASSSSSKKTPEPAAAAAPKKPTTTKGRKRKSSIDPGDASQVAIARRPPLPKSRGLLINRREEPGSMLRTRSGRTSFKPLAYWRNERVEFDKDEAEDAFAGRRNKSKFVLPSVREVVRVDEPEPEVRPKSRRGGGGGGSSKKGVGKRGRRSRRSSGFEEEEEDDGPAEVWELDPGTVTGEVVVWQPEYEFSPPAPNDLVSVMDKQLAISGAAIKTTEVVGGEFRYAKVFSEGFIGAGVVDLPPGAIKRLKNSRKVFMIFFVHAGRVLVTVQETSFRISKGGIFIVPRCKLSSSFPSRRRPVC
jgi:centromere protein C